MEQEFAGDDSEIESLLSAPAHTRMNGQSIAKSPKNCGDLCEEEEKE